VNLIERADVLVKRVTTLRELLDTKDPAAR